MEEGSQIGFSATKVVRRATNLGSTKHLQTNNVYSINEEVSTHHGDEPSQSLRPSADGYQPYNDSAKKQTKVHIGVQRVM